MTAPLPPHPEIDKLGTCRATTTGATGIEWICVAAIHATEADVRAGRPNSYRHYMVRRWPGRTENER